MQMCLLDNLMMDLVHTRGFTGGFFRRFLAEKSVHTPDDSVFRDGYTPKHLVFTIFSPIWSFDRDLMLG